MYIEYRQYVPYVFYHEDKDTMLMEIDGKDIDNIRVFEIAREIKLKKQLPITIEDKP